MEIALPRDAHAGRSIARVRRHGDGDAHRCLRTLCRAAAEAVLDSFGIEIVPLTEARAKAAAAAYRRYGKGWHAAGLNFGDCFAYALAKEHDCPLLFVGDDFALTDVEAALPDRSSLYFATGIIRCA